TSRIVIDMFAYMRTRDLPAPDAPMTYTLGRTVHASEVLGGTPTTFQHDFVYSDGNGRVAQQKSRAEPGPIGTSSENISPRWIGSGWTIYGNKGQAVRKYEQFFSATH